MQMSFLGCRTVFMSESKFGNTKCQKKHIVMHQTYLGHLVGLFPPRVTLLTLASKLAKCGNICNLLAACAKQSHAQHLTVSQISQSQVETQQQ